MAIRYIRKDGDEILRKKSKAVVVVDDRVRQLIKDMSETMYDANGAGLAAPQVGVLKRIIIVDTGEGLISLVNPELIETQGSHDVIEGCLSVPGKWGKLCRPERVKVKGLDEDGKPKIIEGEGDLAKAFCHEIDHLDGVLFIDKVKEYVDL